MQRANPEQLGSMTGVEYCLLYVQEPILYVIRKQHRSSPSHVSPIADYYIIAGVVHQAPDLASVLSSRLLSAVTHLQSAFEEARGYAKYHPSRGYWWDFNNAGSSKAKKSSDPNAVSNGSKKKKKKSVKMDEPSSMFQRRRVDMLLDFWVRKFPPKIATAAAGPQQSQSASNPPSQGKFYSQCC